MYISATQKGRIMETVSIDRRVVKTKRAIRSALATLLLEKDLNEITVKDIAERADVNRKTFYNHYDGIYQVIDEIEGEMVGSLEHSLRDFDIRDSRRAAEQLFARLTDYVNNKPDYAPLLRLRDQASLGPKLVSLLQQKAVETLRPLLRTDDRVLRAGVVFELSGLIAAYQDWYRADNGLPPEELAEMIATLMLHGLNGLLERNA